MEQEKPKFEFKKLEDDKFMFVMKSKDIERNEIVKKDFVKDHYKDLLKQRIQAQDNLAQANKQLEIHKVEHDDELEHFIALANKAATYKKYLDAKNNQSAVLTMMKRINESIDNIEKTLPEVKRMKD